MTAGVLAGCGGGSSKETTKAPEADKTETKAEAEESTEAAAEGSDKPLKVVYLCNGSLGDKGFNDSAERGMQMLKDKLGAEVKTVEMGRDETSYEGNYLDVSEQDWDMIVSGTWSVKELAQDIASQFPEKHYLLFDSDVDRDVVVDGNMMGVNYYSNQAAYLAGVLGAKMLESGRCKDRSVQEGTWLCRFHGYRKHQRFPGRLSGRCQICRSGDQGHDLLCRLL